MKKKIIISASIFLAFVALFAFNKITSSKEDAVYFTEVKKGLFEITITNSGELLAENSLDIKGPEINMNQMNQRGGNRGGMGGMGMGGGMRIVEMKIQDIVPEGTIVSTGDYIAQIDRSSYSNTLQDENENLKTAKDNLDMKILDTAVVLTNLRDDIKNQKYQVEDAKITLMQSQFEPAATIRKAELDLQKAERNLDQKLREYTMRKAKALREINQQKLKYENQQELVNQLQTFLASFTVKAPAPGMVIYKKDRGGVKVKTGSTLMPFENVVATLPDLSKMLSKVYVNEIEVSKLQPGQKVSISVDAFPNKAYTGTVKTIANIGEQLPNSDAKMFEVIISIDQTDHTLRPSMTTTNKILVKKFDDVVYVPTECVQAGADSIPFVYMKNRTKQFVVIGEANDKNVIVEQGLEPGKQIYVIVPEEAEKFREIGKDLIAVTRERNNAKRLENQRLTELYRKKM
ncbi:MAG TPA: efflux RND transporter periplasmic adaptor subunit [Bacteroidales bacterium]|nr:efflux RND transporter periplasmic adaptor subunit [Bacteroidales bacterium]